MKNERRNLHNGMTEVSKYDRTTDGVLDDSSSLPLELRLRYRKSVEDLSVEKAIRSAREQRRIISQVSRYRRRAGAALTH